MMDYGGNSQASDEGRFSSCAYTEDRLKERPCRRFTRERHENRVEGRDGDPKTIRDPDNLKYPDRTSVTDMVTLLK